jgi:hypothetical protein
MIGVFQGTIKDYGVSETKSGNPQVFVKFGFEHEGAAKELTWYGSFVGGAKDITLKTLIYCGLSPQMFSQLVNLRNGVASNMLDLNKVLNLDVQEEPKQDGSGMRTVIQWVNDPNSSPAIKKIDEAKNAQYFGSMGFDGDLVRLAGELGIPMNNGGNQNMNQNNQMQNQNMNQGQNQGQMNMNQGQNQNMNQNQNFNQQQNTQQNVNQNNNQNQNMNQQNNGQNNGGGFSAPF